MLAAIRGTPRAGFVPGDYVTAAYRDEPIPIGHRQVTTQPSLSARMIEGLHLAAVTRCSRSAPAAFPQVPAPLAAQLRIGGRLVQPIGPGGSEQVVLFERSASGLERRHVLTLARFVRLHGRYEKVHQRGCVRVVKALVLGERDAPARDEGYPR